MKNIAFIINPMSGTQNKRRLPKLIVELLDKRQWLENIVFTERVGHAKILAKQYATMGFDAIVAVGGDGTVREVAEGVLGSRSALGIIPMGLTNTLARHIGIPMRGNASITWLNRCEPVECDSLLVNLDDRQQMTAVCSVTAGEQQTVNCAQGMKTSIQDGQMEVNGQTTEESIRLPYSGQILVDGDECDVEQELKVSILPDSIRILAPKRF